MSKFLPLLVLLLFAVTAPAAAQYTFSPEDLVVGQEVTVTLPAPADTVTVTYRPNSSIAVVEHLPTEARQTVAWTPRQAGVVALTTPSGEVQTVSVRFQSVPAGGVFVLAMAGVILFGGIVFASIKLFSAA